MQNSYTSSSRLLFTDFIMDWLRRRGQQFLAKIHILPSGTLPRKQQNADCLLLNLPVEVLELIYGYLPAASQLCLRQTCLATFYSLRNPDQLLRKELLEYLGIAFRNHPDFWVAARRPLLRRFQASDLPDLRTPPVFRNHHGPQHRYTGSSVVL